MTSTAFRSSSRRSLTAAFLGAIVAFGTAALLPAHAAERGPLAHAPAASAVETEARVIVKFKGDSISAQALSASNGAAQRSAGPQQAQALSARLGLSLSDGRPMAPRIQLVRGTGIGSAQLAARLAAQPDVEYAVVDGRKKALAVVPNDPLFGPQTGGTTPVVGQWYLQPPTSTALSAVNAVAAWGVTLGNPSVVVADLDTGVRFDHPDLTSKLLPGYDFVGGSNSPKSIAVANDGDGRDSDASDPGDWVTQAEVNQTGGAFFHCTTPDSSGAYVAQNSSWHGTQTAGLIGAATDNGMGMASIGRNVMVQPLRVLGKCGGFDADIIDAIRWAAGISVPGVTPAVNPTPARVINLSLGAAEGCSAAYQDAINEVTKMNVSVVVAAGNDGLALASPANCVGVIAVVGVRHIGTKVGYSDLGAGATISAPAGNCVNNSGACLYPVLTTSNSGTQAPVAGAAGAIYTDGGANASLGTSFSSPIVAGTVALMVSANAAMTPGQIKNALMATARSFPSTGAAPSVRACTAPTAKAQSSECYCTTSTCGAGLLDAGAAVQAAVSQWANITATPTYPLNGQPVTLLGALSTPAGAVGNATYAWQVLSGAGAITAGAQQASVTVLPSAPGSVVARLTASDPSGRTTTSDTTLSASGAPTAAISASASSVSAGQSVTLDGSGSASSVTGSLTIASYQWTVTSGSGSFSGAVDQPTANLLTSAAGSAMVTLTVTDSAGQQNTVSSVVTVTPAAVVTPPPASAPAPSSGGGGAMSIEWLLAGAIAVWAVRRVTPRSAGRRRLAGP